VHNSWEIQSLAFFEIQIPLLKIALDYSPNCTLMIPNHLLVAPRPQKNPEVKAHYIEFLVKQMIIHLGKVLSLEDMPL